MILGCTHYPFVRALLQRLLGPEVALVTSGTAIARRVGHALALQGPRDAARRAPRAATASCAPATRTRSPTIGTRFLQLPMGAVDHVELPREEALA